MNNNNSLINTLEEFIETYGRELTLDERNILADFVDYTEKSEKRSLEQRRNDFIETLKPFLEQYGREMMNDFAKYWLERAPKGKKYRFEKEKAFDVERRLITWKKNTLKFSIANALRK